MTSLPPDFESPAARRWPCGLALMAACAQPPKSPAEAPPAPAEATVPAATPQPAEPIAPPQPPALTAAEVPRTVSSAIEHLEAGQEALAEAELKRVLQADPSNRLAQSLLQQIKDDPQAVLGRESFSYKVLPGESLSKIAQRFMNDVHQFYILARYNNIKVPRSLAGGQTIRVPGKAPPPGSLQAVAPAVTPVVNVPPPAAPEPAPNAVSPEKARAEAVARHTRNARSAFAKQDLDAAIRSWDEVLKLDPDNRIAILEKDKVVALKDKLTKLK
jgi:tetratricopeptide (TPR) repeat protein